mmetsp:Transcript_21204/g.56569  ORF Transcript_21204/g.56569 Transcript_21204/m.56569 type:complete len:213 (+) Transcript_21204:2453-3091(+)
MGLLQESEFVVCVECWVGAMLDCAASSTSGRSCSCRGGETEGVGGGAAYPGGAAHEGEGSDPTACNRQRCDRSHTDARVGCRSSSNCDSGAGSSTGEACGPASGDAVLPEGNIFLQCHQSFTAYDCVVRPRGNHRAASDWLDLRPEGVRSATGRGHRGRGLVPRLGGLRAEVITAGTVMSRLGPGARATGPRSEIRERPWRRVLLLAVISRR